VKKIDWLASFLENLENKEAMSMPPAEKDFADALLGIAAKYGKLSDNDGNGIWIGYVSKEDNDNYEIGVRCENCALYQSPSVCKIIKQKIEPGGYCRLAAIYDGVVKPDATSDGSDDSEDSENDD
jgi:hypothetical protein